MSVYLEKKISVSYKTLNQFKTHLKHLLSLNILDAHGHGKGQEICMATTSIPK